MKMVVHERPVGKAEVKVNAGIDRPAAPETDTALRRKADNAADEKRRAEKNPRENTAKQQQEQKHDDRAGTQQDRADNAAALIPRGHSLRRKGRRIVLHFRRGRLAPRRVLAAHERIERHAEKLREL